MTYSTSMISRPAGRSATPGVVCTVWRMSCEQLHEFDKMLEAKDEQIKSLLEKMQQLEVGHTHLQRLEVGHTHLQRLEVGHTHLQRLEVGHTHLQQLSRHCSTSSNTFHQGAATNLRRMGKAPPVDQFPGDQGDLTFDDWLPLLA